MREGLMRCPNCEAAMNEGDTCPECDHDERCIDPLDCPCQHCSTLAAEVQEAIEADLAKPEKPVPGDRDWPEWWEDNLDDVE